MKCASIGVSLNLEPKLARKNKSVCLALPVGQRLADREVIPEDEKESWEGREQAPSLRCPPTCKMQKLRGELQVRLHGWLQVGGREILWPGLTRDQIQRGLVCNANCCEFYHESQGGRN